MAAAVLLAGWLAFPELVNRIPDLNDNILHRGIIERMVDATRRGEDPTDPWLTQWVLGSPMLHFYPFAGHAVAALPVLLTGGRISSLVSLRVTTWLLLCLLPISIAVMMRALTVPRPGAALAALATPLVAATGLFGLSFETYTWAGFGLFPQLWGAVIAPLAVAAGLAAFRSGRRHVGAGALLGGAWLCHPLFGYLATFTLLIAALLERDRRIWPRAIFVFTVMAATALPLVAPLLLDRAYTGFSVWDEAWRRDSWGWRFVFSRLAAGRILDDGRAPVLTLIALVGLIVSVRRLLVPRRRGRGPLDGLPSRLVSELLLVSLAIWTLAYVGRAGIGHAVDLLPFASSLHLHRMIIGVQWSLLGFVGVGGAWIWAKLGWERRRTGVWTAALLTIAVLQPAIHERWSTSRVISSWRRLTEDALRNDRDFDAVLRRLATLPRGRVFAGPVRGWGGDLKVGFIPVYSLLSSYGYDMLSYIYTYSMTSDIMPVFDPSRPAHYDLTNVRYVVSDTSRSLQARPIFTSGRYRLWEARTTGYLGIADTVERWEPPADRRQSGQDRARAIINASISWMQSADVEGRRFLCMEPPTGRLADTGSPRAPADSGSLPGIVLKESAGGNLNSGKVSLFRDAFVMLKSSYDPHWRGSIDGRPTSVYLLSPGYPAIRVPAGAHDVSFEYCYARWRWLLAGTALVLALAFVERLVPGLSRRGGTSVEVRKRNAEV